MATFSEVFEDVTRQGRKLQTSEYKEQGKYVIIDQGQNDIAGYTNETDGLFTDVPAIVFGDHTRVLKYVDTPCFLGADGVKLLKAKIDNPNYRYLFYALSHADIPNTGYNRHFKWLKEININLPSEQRQHEIVAVLDKVSDLISLRKQQLAKLDELVKSRFIELFGSVEDENTLINLCTFIDYRGKTPEKAESGLPFITAKNVKMHYMSFDTQEFISQETYDKVMTRGFPRIGDVVFTTEAPLGNVCRIPYIETEFYIGQRIITMQTDQLEPAYLEYALSSDEFKRKIAEKSSGSTVTGIRSKLLEQLSIPVPPRALQKQFAAFIEQVDKSKLEIQQSLDKLEILKKALMQKYFG